jgi:hypothetical protein
MERAAGDFVLGEGAIAARTLARRLWTGPRRFGFAVYTLFALFGLWGVGWVGARFVSGDPLTQGGVTMGLMILYIVPLSFIYLGWRQRAIKRIWSERGQVDPLPMQWIVDETGFTVIQTGQETRIAWDAVSEIIPARKHWLILANMAAHTVPRRCFADVAAERAFIAAAVAQLSQAARARSPEAMALAS